VRRNVRFDGKIVAVQAHLHLAIDLTAVTVFHAALVDTVLVDTVLDDTTPVDTTPVDTAPVDTAPGEMVVVTWSFDSDGSGGTGRDVGPGPCRGGGARVPLTF
jgi:hypothetical protein